MNSYEEDLPSGVVSLKILMPVHSFLPKHQAGAEIYTYNLAKELSKRHEVVVLYADTDSAKDDYSVSKGYYDGLPFYKIINNRSYAAFEEAYNNPRMDRLFNEILDEVKPDIVHFQHLLNLSVNFIRIAKEKGIPVIFTLHEYWLMCLNGGQMIKKRKKSSSWLSPEICFEINPEECARCIASLSMKRLIPKRYYSLLRKRSANFLVKGGQSDGLKKSNLRNSLRRSIISCDRFTKSWKEKIQWAMSKEDCFVKAQKRLSYIRNVCKDVDLFIAPSPFLRSMFIKFGIPEEKIIYSDYGMNVGYYKDIHKQSSAKIRFTFIGSPVVHKGVHVLVDAFNGINDDNAELNIFGDLSMQPEYSYPLKETSKNPNVHFMGRFENTKIADVLSNTDILVVPSIWYENSPLTIHEAFIAGIPVVTSNLGGMADLVQDGVNGLLFKVGDASDLRSKILSLIREPGLIERLRQGIPKVKTIEEEAVFIEEVYMTLHRTQMVPNEI
ncbi:MAG: glycosyltransferase [Nitrospira sp.]|nr:glycosyltransferase [Nitrospira sp.]